MKAELTRAARVKSLSRRTEGSRKLIDFLKSPASYPHQPRRVLLRQTHISWVFIASPFVRGLWPLPTALFAIGWIFQFVGHYYEGKPPEFFKDPRLLLVGLWWWVAKMRGKA